MKVWGYVQVTSRNSPEDNEENIRPENRISSALPYT